MPKAVQTQCEAEASMPHLRLSVRDDGLVYSETHDVVEDYCVSSEGYLRVMAGCQVLVHFFKVQMIWKKVVGVMAKSLMEVVLRRDGSRSECWEWKRCVLNCKFIAIWSLLLCIAFRWLDLTCLTDLIVYCSQALACHCRQRVRPCSYRNRHTV